RLPRISRCPSHRHSRCSRDCRRACRRKDRLPRRRRLKENQRRQRAARSSQSVRTPPACSERRVCRRRNAARPRRAYHPMQFGDYRVEIIPDCEFRLDGGAMFGVVPRNLWSKPCPPDDQNRIRMNMNCLFIEAGRERILIDTGIGDKWSEKHRAMYGINRIRSLDESLKEIAGVTSSDITIVINTHLHFDHAGGNTLIDESGKAVPAFPKARYFVSRAEFEHAEAPTDRDRASYFAENWQPVRQSGQLELKDS